ncbi:MAG: helix-turn-helix domain-containing protein [Colwellia sp.]|nr:helix-turn-helix domain-containing protein [Colwellia sp.]
MKIFDIQNNVLNVVEIITVQLQSNEAITVSLLASNPTREITSLDLRAEGVRSPNQSIGRIKQKGAIIKSTRRNITDEFGKVHKGIACYALQGWK